MGTKEINKIPIPEFLKSLSILPERKCNGYWMYKSFINPNQRSGSLKISSNNLWVDYSLNNTGGTFIDLILMIYPELTVKDIVRKFNSGIFSFHQPEKLIAIEKKKVGDSIIILNEHDIFRQPYLFKYLSEERGISNIDMASRYLKSYQYRWQNSNKEYWSLGTKNCLDGYILFSKNFKTVTKQGYTLFENSGAKSRIYFEGILDLLSFLMIYPDQENLHEYCVLNTVNNIKMTFDIIPLRMDNPLQIIGFFDRDFAGDKATELLKMKSENHGLKFYDYRSTFKGKDLNDYLLGKY
jgi:hypothetical protein